MKTSVNVPKSSARYFCSESIIGTSESVCGRLNEPIEIGEPHFDKRPNLILEAGFPGHPKRLLERLPDLFVGDALLQAVVTRDEQLLDPFSRVARLHVG